MSEFEKKNLPCDDYTALTQNWENQLRQLGYHRAWDSDNGEYGWRASAGGPVQTTYERFEVRNRKRTTCADVSEASLI